ncbi:hypothetical protein [Companilactobacillus mindensis]|uniref:hypothetical protein n=1 Tax=Companilactobacillus mindensis TaxID=167481 RepID=UPI0011BE5E3E|nr:hypothetical protein [Companilactobacillus mindensis]
MYKSKDYFDDIHNIYIGASSKNNDGFIGKNYIKKFDLSDQDDTYKVLDLLKSKVYMKINIDESCIVGWAEKFYREHPKASKGDFIGDDTGLVKITGEIREPYFFKDFILPYTEGTNEKFKYLMDKLNDRLNKKDLGAYYTAIPYAKKAAELVRNAISKVPSGNDYIILDRCAGTGNLESVLSDDELSHCVLSTYEYYEYKVLMERLADKVRTIIPPTENLVKYSSGFVLNGNALEKEYLDNSIINSYLKDKNCTIIMFENPPYQDSSSITFVENGDISRRATTRRKGSFVLEEFKKDIKKFNGQQAVAREISNLFIWSAFKYYLRQSTDSYIVFSPVKYFKSANIVNKKFIKGFLFNRKHFHASPSSISCIQWQNIDDFKLDSLSLDAYDIVNNDILDIKKTIVIKKIETNISLLNDTRKFSNDLSGGSVVKSNGYEDEKWQHHSNGRQPIYNDNIVGYLVSKSSMIDPKHYNLVRTNFNTALKNSYGFWLRKDNYLKKLPMFVAKVIPLKNWYDKDVYFTSNDGGDAFEKDDKFLLNCLIFTCLTPKNKCISFNGSDHRLYLNELCFDTGSLASEYILSQSLNDYQHRIISLWYRILKEAKETDDYNDEYNYGMYQIIQELDTYYKNDKNKKVYNYTELHSDIISMKSNLNEFYNSYIKDDMFKYELIK